MTVLPAEVIVEVLRLAAESQLEICGLISSDFEIYPIKNVSRYPESSFVMDKQKYFDTISRLCNADKGVLCLYHSHPSSGPEPSQGDLKFMRRSNYDMLIVSPKGYRLVEHAA